MADLPDFDFILNGSTLLAFAATVLLACLSARLGRRSDRSATADIVPIAPAATKRLPVEQDDPDYRESVTVSQRIADLIIADEWVEIADRISDWEAKLTSTPGGTRYHDIAVQTCLSGLRGLIDDAPRNAFSDLDDARMELGHFLDTHRQMPENHVLALLAARAHIALADAFRADDWPADLHRAAWRKQAQHTIAAGEILEPFDAIAYMSPLLAEAHYLQAVDAPGAADRLQPLFADWIDLDPSNSRIYDTHVSAMIRHQAFTGDDVLREADAAMERTEETLGFGGYALFFMPLLTEFDAARDLLDPDLYASALLDLASNSATQAEVNHAAAALLTEIESANEPAATVFRDALFMMIRQHMQVIYPRVWPISVQEVQDLAVEAAAALPDVTPVQSRPFVTSRPLSQAA